MKRQRPFVRRTWQHHVWYWKRCARMVKQTCWGESARVGLKQERECQLTRTCLMGSGKTVSSRESSCGESTTGPAEETNRPGPFPAAIVSIQVPDCLAQTCTPAVAFWQPLSWEMSTVKAVNRRIASCNNGGHFPPSDHKLAMTRSLILGLSSRSLTAQQKAGATG